MKRITAIAIVLASLVGTSYVGASHAQGKVCNDAVALKYVDSVDQYYNVGLSQVERGAMCDAVHAFNKFRIPVDQIKTTEYYYEAGRVQAQYNLQRDVKFYANFLWSVYHD